MVDTIVLLLTTNAYKINQTLWGPKSKTKKNPTVKELKEGNYKPRLTLFTHRSPFASPQPMLKIELSLPKLYFGNNFEELQKKDLLPLLGKLVSCLTTMGVITTEDDLANAMVSSIHYSKNIILTDGSTPHYYITKIQEANVPQTLDVNQTEYRNTGYCYKWHCNSYEIVFYDKIKDLEKAYQSSRRAFEKENTLQLHLRNRFKYRRKWEVFRMEVRLSKRDKIKRLFKKLGIKSDLTFKSLFKPAIAKKVLLHYMDELERKRPPLLDFRVKSRLTPDYEGQADKKLLSLLILNNPQLHPKKIFELYGLKKALEFVTLRELRAMLAKHSVRSWHRLMADVKNVIIPGVKSPFTTLYQQIIKFKAVRLRKSKSHHKESVQHESNTYSQSQY